MKNHSIIKDGVTWLFSNVNSLFNKIDDICILLGDNSHDIMIFVETWLTEDFTNDDLNIEGYNIFIRKDRTGKKRGGIICYIKSDINIFSEAIFFEEINLIESIWFLIKIKYKRYIIVVFYRPLNSCYQQDLKIIKILKEAYIYFVKNSFSDLIIMGDFNLPKIDWKNGTHSYASDSFGDLFFSLSVVNYLYRIL